MWDNKMKAITFSFDDNVTQDVRLTEIFNRYGLKCTFNLNSALIGTENTLVRNGVTVRHDKNALADIPKIYAGHEIAVHTLTHPNLTKLTDDEIVSEVENDRLALSDIAGYEVVGMAYPGGRFDDRVVRLIKERTGVKYSRTTVSTHAFDRQEELITFHPSVYYIEHCLFDVCQRFLDTPAEKPQLLYIWGHAYEMDSGDISWEKMEELCRLLSAHDDIYYGTNAQCLLEV